MAASFYRVTYVDRGTGKKRTKDWYVPAAQVARKLTFEQLGEVLDIQSRKTQWWDDNKFSKDYKVVFLNSMKFHLEVGSSPGRALSDVIDAETEPKLRLALQPALEVLNRGGTFSDALDSLRMFNQSTLTLIKTGESTGNLPNAISSAAKYIEDNNLMWREASAKMAFIGFEFFLGFSGVLAMPTLVKELTGGTASNVTGEKALELASQVDFVNTVSYVTIYGTYVLLAFLFAMVAGYLIKSTRGPVEGFIKRLGFIKMLLVDSAFADSFTVMSRLMKGRVSFDQAIDLTVKGNRSPMVKNYWTEVKRKVIQGIPLATAMTEGDELTHSEKVQLRAHNSMDQFSMILEKLAEQRWFLYARGLKLMVRTSTVLLLLYGGIVMYLGWLLISTQDMGLEGMMQSI